MKHVSEGHERSGVCVPCRNQAVSISVKWLTTRTYFVCRTSWRSRRPTSSIPLSELQLGTNTRLARQIAIAARARAGHRNLPCTTIKTSLSRLDELSIAFDYDGEVTATDAEEILSRIGTLYGLVLEGAETAAGTERKEALRQFASNPNKSFYGFEPDFFRQNLIRIVDDVVSVIKGSIELWPSLVEICYFPKGPQRSTAGSRRQSTEVMFIAPLHSPDDLIAKAYGLVAGSASRTVLAALLPRLKDWCPSKSARNWLRGLCAHSDIAHKLFPEVDRSDR